MTIEVAEDSIPGQLDSIRARLDHGDIRMRQIEGAVAENTLLTRGAIEKLDAAATVLGDIKDAQTAGRILKKFVVGTGAVAGAGAAIAAAWHTFMPPK